jgi:dihydroxyacetone kinase-like protein
VTKTEFAERLQHACEAVVAAEDELTAIDSKFGDGDHGLTMRKIAEAISESVDASDGSIKAMLDDAATAVMCLNGGSAVPLWNSWLDGMQEAAPDAGEIDVPGLKAMFAKALDSLNDVSGAKVGDKTMMDALIPASRAIADYKGNSEAELFADAAGAAEQGAEDSKKYVSKYGRAKSYGTQTLGTPDVGAVSMAYFFKGLAEAQTA